MANHETPDGAAQGGSARFGHRARTGGNEPIRGEKKEQRADWIPRQGGDQSRDPNRHGRRRGETRDEERR